MRALHPLTNWCSTMYLNVVAGRIKPYQATLIKTCGPVQEGSGLSSVVCAQMCNALREKVKKL